MVSIKIDGIDYFYDDQKPLGEGSSFISYKAEDQKGRPTILKISKNNSIKPVKETIIAYGGGDYSINQVINKEYMKELYAVLYSEELVNKVCHFDYYSIDENIYVLQDYNFGDTLANFHFNYYEEVYEVAKSVISLTCKIHSKGWLILDLKPSNLLVVKIDEKLIVKLIDFDSLISKEKLHSDDLDQEIKTTVKYASPEIIKLKEFYDKQNYCIDMNECKEYKEKIDENSDLYSIGIILKNILSQNPNLGFISIVDDDEKRKIKMLFNRIIYTTKDNNEDEYYDKLSDINSYLYSMQQLFGNSYQNHIFDDKFNDYLNYKHDNQIIDYLLDELSSHVNKKIKREYDSVALYDSDDLDDLDDLINIKCHICNKSYDIAKSALEEMKKIFAFRQPRPLLLVYSLLVYIDIDNEEFEFFDNEIKPEINNEICRLLSLVDSPFGEYYDGPFLSFIFEYFKSLYLMKKGNYIKAIENIKNNLSKLLLKMNSSKLPKNFINKAYFVNKELYQIKTKIMIQACFELAQCAKETSLYDESINVFKTAIEFATEIDDRYLILKAEIDIIDCLQQQSKYEEANIYIDKALELRQTYIDELDQEIEYSLLATLYSLSAINYDALNNFKLAKYTAINAYVIFHQLKNNQDENLIRILIILAKYSIEDQTIKNKYLNEALDLLNLSSSQNEQYKFLIKYLYSIQPDRNIEECKNQSFDELFETGESFVNRGEYAQAIDYLQSAKMTSLISVVSVDRLFRVLFHLGYSLHMCKKYTEAIKNYDLALYCTNEKNHLNKLVFNTVIAYYYSRDYKGMFSYMINTNTEIDTLTYSRLSNFFNDHMNCIILNVDDFHTITNEISERMDKMDYDNVTLNDKIIIDLNSLVRNKINLKTEI